MISRPGKTKIRPPRKGLINPGNEVNFEETWTIISDALREMHTKNASKLSFEAIYRQAYKVVLKKKGEMFYDRIQAFEREWLSSQVRQRLQSLLAPSLYHGSQLNRSAATPNERRAAGERFLRGLKGAFEDHQLVMNMATDVFMYLDRVFCNDHRKPSIYTSGMMQFRDCILKSSSSEHVPDMLTILNGIILEQIAMDRDGDPIDKSLIKSCINVLEGLHETASENEDDRLYLTSFEHLFLSASREFYKAESARLLQNADAATYCRRTLTRIHEETQRCDTTLSEVTKPKITSVLEDELIKNKLRDLIVTESGVKHMVDNDRFEDLKLVYALNSRVDPRKLGLTEAIQRGVQELVSQINDTAATASNPNAGQSAQGEQEGGDAKARPPAERAAANIQTTAAIQWVEAVLKLKDKYDQIWEESLESDKIIQPALTRSFTESINVFQRSSEFISLFLDENMKKGLKDKTEAEVDQILEKAIILLRYIQDKDMFERYYKKHLCKRLLMQKSLSIENEREMIRKMKNELGNSFVSKLEAMFKDMQLSEELTSGYRARTADSGTDSEGKRTDLSINVLTSMTWPLETMSTSSSEDTSSKSKCIFPAAIERVKTGFEAFYAGKHSGRQLTWMPHMGTADIRVMFPKIPGKEGPLGRERRHELNVSTYAMFVLMLFNDIPTSTSLSFDDIQARTNIGTSDLVRNLQALAVASKTRILIKEPMSKDVKNTDRFSFNERFTSNYLRIKVGVVAGGGNKVEGERERRETEKKNNDSRGFIIEAAIVRIMKQRKELAHQQLLSETIAQLTSQFRPDVNMIKQRVEALIEREYLERIDNSSPPAYRYLA